MTPNPAGDSSLPAQRASGSRLGTPKSRKGMVLRTIPPGVGSFRARRLPRGAPSKHIFLRDFLGFEGIGALGWGVRW